MAQHFLGRTVESLTQAISSVKYSGGFPVFNFLHKVNSYTFEPRFCIKLFGRLWYKINRCILVTLLYDSNYFAISVIVQSETFFSMCTI